jgi:hypothetical protein
MAGSLGVKLIETKLVGELVNRWGSIFVNHSCRNPEEEERPPLQASTKQRQRRLDCGHYVCNSDM